MKRKPKETLLVLKQSAVIEGVFRIEGMTQRNVRNFVSQGQTETCLIGKHIDQSSTQHDRVYHRERFDRCRQQDSCSDWRLNVTVIRDFQVVNDGLQAFVHRSVRSKQAGLFQSL